jgi:5-methylcytosine-specific restriction endonuclease McrA
MKRKRAKISKALQNKIRRQARFRCGYCLCSEVLLGMPMEIEHLIAVAIGGTDDEENLWLSCRRCNGFKGILMQAIDPLSGQLANLFNPRSQQWSKHFRWSEDGTQIVGLTQGGRATVEALKLNNPEITVTRRLWVSVGWWPPVE